MNDIIVIEPMTETEARETVNQINNKVSEMGRLLTDLRDRQGWKVLGYRNWTDCLTNEFEYSRQHLYRLMHTHEVNENLSPEGYKVNTKQAEVLKDYPSILQPVIAETVTNRHGEKAAPGLYRVVGDILHEVMSTGGHVGSGTGKSERIEDALDEAEREYKKRKIQHVQDKYETWETDVKVLPNGQVFLVTPLPEHLQGIHLKARFSRPKAA